jgi:hypothetical protein
VDLSEKGKAFIEKMEEARRQDLERRSSCFTEEEKAQFCALSNRLSDHMESLAADIPEFMRRPPRHGRPPFPPEGGFPGDMPPCPGEPPCPPDGETPGEPPRFPHPDRPQIPPDKRMKC